MGENRGFGGHTQGPWLQSLLHKTCAGFWAEGLPTATLVKPGWLRGRGQARSQKQVTVCLSEATIPSLHAGQVKESNNTLTLGDYPKDTTSPQNQTAHQDRGALRAECGAHTQVLLTGVCVGTFEKTASERVPSFMWLTFQFQNIFSDSYYSPHRQIWGHLFTAHPTRPPHPASRTHLALQLPRGEASAAPLPGSVLGWV